MENLHAQIIDYLLTQSWQIGVLAVAIAAVSLAVKNKSAHVRYLLWLIVLAKCLVPPLLTITLAVLPQKEVAEPVVTTPVEIPAVAVMVEVVPTGPVTLPSRTVLAPPVEPSIAERLAEVTFRQWLAVVWIIGVGVFVLAAVIKALRVNQWLRRERRALPAKLQSGIEKLFAELGVKTVPKVWLVEGIGQPFVWGLMRGSIYLPGNFVGVKGDESRRGVLGHELSHILRFDAAVNLLQIIAQAIFWFHPFVWWANKKIRAEREKCCDEMAIARLGAKAKDYSRAIVNTLIAEHEATLPIPSLAIAGPVKNIEDRIKTIMSPGKKFYKRPSLIAAMAVLVLALAAVPTTLVLTQRSEKQATSKRLKKEQEKENRDYKVLSPKLDALLGAWRATQPEPNDIGSSEYNVNLVIDLRDRKLYLERNWQEDSGTVVTMPEGYVWEIAHINPNDYKQLGDIVRLRLRGHNRQKNICPEAIVIQGRLGNEAGICICIEPGNGYKAHWATGQGGWKAWPSYVSRRKRKPRGRYTINRSLFLSKAEAQMEAVKEGMDVDAILAKVRRAQRPAGNMRIEWVSEKDLAHSYYYRYRTKKKRPTKEPVIEKSNAVISGKRSRIERREEYYEGEVVGEPLRVLCTTSVFDGAEQRKLEELAEGYERGGKSGYIASEERNTSLLTELLFGSNPLQHSKEQLEEYKFKLELLENDVSGIYVLKITEPEGQLYDLITVDGNRGYNIVKRELVRSSDDVKLLGDDYELKRYTNGIWFLSKREKVRYTSGLDVLAKPRLEEKITITNVQFDMPEPDGKMFKLEFPAETKVRILGSEIAISEDGEEELRQVIESAKKLQGLGKALIIYANEDEEGKLPDTLQQLHKEDYVSEKDLEWFLANIEYLGKGKTTVDAPDTVIAYDKTLLRKGKGTNVSFLDGHVAFERPEQLEKLGIAGELAGHEISVIGRVLDRPGGKGVAAVKVKLWSDWTRQSWFALTNEKGNYRFDDIEPGPYILRVVDPLAGVWTEGVAVLVTPDPQRRRPQKTKLIRSAREGYRIAEVGTGPGQYKVSERRDGDTFEAIVITSDKQQQQRVDIYQQLRQGISGTVRDKDTGQPVAGATVDFLTIDRLRQSVRTDSEGRYRLYVPPRTIPLHCEGTTEQFCPVEMGDRHIRVGQGEYIENIDFLVRSAPSFTGQVVFGDGSKAPEGVEVRAYLCWRPKELTGGGGYAWTEVQYMKTDESGAFTGYFKDPYHLQDSERYEVLITACARMPDASKGGAWSATTEAANPNVGEMKIVLEKTGSAEFRVVGPEGQGVTGLEVICEHWVKVNDGLRATVTELGGGRYRAGRLIPGLEYRCWVQAKDYRQEYIRDIKPIVVRPGQHVQAPDIEFRWWGKKVGIPYDLGRTGSDATEVVPTLLEVLKKSTDETAICRTAEALGKIGVASKPVLKALLDLLENKRGNAANAAAEALGRLGSVEAIVPIEAALNAGTIKHQIGTTALWRIKKAFNAKPIAVVGYDEPVWGEAVDGLRCRWSGAVKEVRAGAAAVLGMEIENVSGEEIFWQCREGTWLIRHPRAAPGIPAGTSPRFEVSLGEGVREATREEAQPRHEGSGSAIGYYVLEPGAKMIITAAYPYPLVESGSVEVEGFLHRENPGGGGGYFVGQVLRNVMTCPPLVLEIVGGVKKPVIEGLSVSVACAGPSVKTADELELVVSIENRSGGEVELDHSGLEDDFPVVTLDMVSQESGPHILCTKEGGGYGTGLVSKALKNNENKSKTIYFSDCWRWYGGRPILSPGRYRVIAKVGRITPEGALVEAESQPIWVTISEWPWGEAMEGVQVRLRPDKAMFEAGEPVSLKADIYNGGKSEVFGQQTKHGISQLQFDNQWYEWGGGPVLGPPIKPGGQVEGIPVPLDNIWMGENKLNLSPGKHIIRVGLVGSRSQDSGAGAIMAVSNPVEITIIAGEVADETGTAVAMGVYKQLDEIVELFGWRPEMSFGDAIEELRSSVEPPLQIAVLWKDLAENADIEQISIGPLPPVRLSFALELLLKSVSGGKAELGYAVGDGTITIATVDSLPNKLETRVYDIALLVGPPLPGGYGGYGATFYGKYRPSAEAIEKSNERAKEIAKLIEELIEPDSWWGASGQGVIRLYDNRKLIVLQTREVHQKIEKLLRNMQRPGLGEAGIPHAGEAAYPVPWWQAARKSKPNSAVQIEGRFILVPADANEIKEFLEELEDFEIAPLWAEPNVKHYLLEGEESGQLLKKLMEGDPNCSKTLAAPKVTVLSGESAALSIQTQTVVALPPQVTGEMLPRMIGPGTAETIPTGTTLTVTPVISPDKKDILLNLSVQMNNFLGMKTYNFETPLPDGTVAKYEQELPQIETVSVQTRVSIPDGGTILLAGQKVKSKGEQDGQIVEKDLLILIKAEIVELDPNAVKPAYRFGGGYGGGSYGLGGYGGYGGGGYGSRYGGGGMYGGGGYGSRYGGGRVGPYGGGIEAYRKYPAAPPVKSKEPNRPGGNLSPPRAFGGFGG